MLCKKCGKENDEQDLYCVYCGALLEHKSEAEEPEGWSIDEPVEEPEGWSMDEPEEEAPVEALASEEPEPVPEPVKEPAPEPMPVPEEVPEPVKETAPAPKAEPVPAPAPEPDKSLENKKKTTEKKVNSSVKIAMVIVLLMGIAFLSAGFALGLFDDIEEFIETKKEEIAVEQKKPGKAAAASTLADAVFEGKTVFDCTTETDALLDKILGEYELSRYTLVDFDGDGKKELVLEAGGKTETDRLMIVMHQAKKRVLEKVFSYRDMQLISELGTFKGNRDEAVDVYGALQIDDKSIEAVEIATGEFSVQKIAEKTGAELAEVSLEEFTNIVNRRFGARAVGFKDYTEEELKKDLEDPDGFDLIEVQDMGTAYWGMVIPEMAQYNDLLGSSYSKFERRENYVYSDDAKWEEEAAQLLCCTIGDGLKYVGTDDSIYKAEYIGVKDDAIIMSGAATDKKETLAQDFMLDDADFMNPPAQFGVRKAEGKDKGVTALVWSCGDTYLCIFVDGDAGKTAFYDRPVMGVCYIMKDCTDILGYPQIFE